MTPTSAIDLSVHRDVRKGFKDNHGRTWVRCAPGDTGGTWWNMRDGSRIRCRLKYPSEWNKTEMPEDEL